MNFNEDLLEHYISKNPDIVRNLKTILDATDGWKEIVYELQKYRIPVFLNVDSLNNNHSPTASLLNELLKRSCTLQDFKDLLRQSNLFDVLSLLENPEPADIIIQPGLNYEKIPVALGEDLRLECVAVGLPPPKYQWFCDNNMLSCCTASTLIISDFKEENEGEYYCIVNQKTDDYLIEVTSNAVICSLLETLPVIAKSPPRTLYPKLGSEVKLEVEILCRFKYKIEWIKENQILEGENESVLWIKSVEQSDTGVYRCVVKNSAGEVFSEPCDVIVLMEQTRRNKASAKVALLIANSKYDHFSELQTPTADVILLADKLEALNFHVITLINLTLQDMKASIDWFFENLPSKAYAFFCFIGHGFLLLNNKFMMPVDCPTQNQYKMADCIWDALLIKKAQERKLKLLVTVLDMCLKGPDSNDNPDIFNEKHPNYSYEPYHKCSIVQAFATSNYQGAYENPNMANGVYINHICNYLESDKMIVHVFQNAHEEFQKNKVIKLQTPFLSFDANMNFKFTDPVEESDDITNKLLPFTRAKELKFYHELYFPDIDLHTTLFAMPHRGRILNSIDMQFSQTLSNQWNPSAWISPDTQHKSMENLAESPALSRETLTGEESPCERLESVMSFNTLDALKYDAPDLTCGWTTSTKDDNCSFLTLFNIEKVKSNIYITTALYDKEHRVTLKSDSVIDLGLPLIASAKLWLIQK